MVLSNDPEKVNFHKPDPMTNASQNRNLTEEELEKDGDTTASSPIHASRSNSSHDTINSDPLSPLEHALTPDLETDAEHLARPALTYTRTGASLATTGSRIPSFEVDFGAEDLDDPKNWPMWYKGLTIGAVSYSTWTVVLYSTSYTTSMPGMMKDFHVSSEPVATLGVTMYLVGLAVGSLILAPLSEIYGRRPVYIGSLCFFCLMILPCALAKSLPEVLIFRFLG
jgi:hypothetical protein